MFRLWGDLRKAVEGFLWAPSSFWGFSAAQISSPGSPKRRGSIAHAVSPDWREQPATHALSKRKGPQSPKPPRPPQLAAPLHSLAGITMTKPFSELKHTISTSYWQNNSSIFATHVRMSIRRSLFAKIVHSRTYKFGTI